MSPAQCLAGSAQCEGQSPDSDDTQFTTTINIVNATEAADDIHLCKGALWWHSPASEACIHFLVVCQSWGLCQKLVSLPFCVQLIMF